MGRWVFSFFLVCYFSYIWGLIYTKWDNVQGVCVSRVFKQLTSHMSARLIISACLTILISGYYCCVCVCVWKKLRTLTLFLGVTSLMFEYLSFKYVVTYISAISYTDKVWTLLILCKKLALDVAVYCLQTIEM